MTYVQVENIDKWYESGDTREHAVDDLSFSVKEGDIFTILGPSGCGKTTTLRSIAGLETINSGRIRINDEVVSDPSRLISLSPDKREIGLMYQSYALWPHMTVKKNITYALDGRDYAGDNDERVVEVLELVGLPEIGDRYPNELSGGQQQRVAFARALSYEPDVLLMDEPLSNLDLKQRRQMRTKLLDILDDVKMTTIYVTHDQEEAFEISDEILVMNNGKKAQQGPPEELYQNPTSSFVADFIGEANTFDATMANGTAERCLLRGASEPLELSTNWTEGNAISEPVVTIRSEDISLFDGPNDDRDGVENVITGTVSQKRFRGDATLYLIDVNGVEFKVQTDDPHYRPGQQVTMEVPSKSVAVVQR
jgi:ABC-type Fe3+/spermidine/putrescine transport system ATPase subunit